MKKIAASVGLVALGASFVHAQDSFISAEPTKIWKVSASLRGFYDDNEATQPNGTNKISSFGYSISPGASLAFQTEQTTLSLDYVYTLIAYEKQAPGFRKYDQNHLFNGSLTHTFSERYQLTVNDSFAVGQEPDTLRTGDAVTSPFRQPGNNYRNDAGVTFNAQVTPLFGLEAGYNNGWFDYHQSGGNYLFPSESGVADRIENTFHLDGRWQVLPETVAVVGYQYGMADYTGDEQIGIGIAGGVPVILMSNSRNWHAHYGYLGVDQNFTSQLRASARVGVRSTDYYNDPAGRSDLSPYVRLGLDYRYAPESSVDVGFTYDRSATDLVGTSTNGITEAQQAATLYATITHRILPNLFLNANAQFQYSTSVGGSLDGQTEKIYLLGLGLEYRFNHYLAAQLGYNYDKIDSQVGRSYDRNRVYVGIVGTY